MSQNLTKVHSIEQSFSQSKTFGFSEISSHFVSLMTEIFCFTCISQILTLEIEEFYSQEYCQQCGCVNMTRGHEM